ncbi:lipoprotein [Emticicia aquatilis]|uniref:Lipoprotein n=1 Tax=Emticicia aquatilis TaxID=1537369 RepID=A0A916ZAE1_9BACT|nr:TraB/GumN family protein [Emticicia aquatilis]GGD83798.1 lipoprotein [Emticicia aquatilis]
MYKKLITLLVSIFTVFQTQAQQTPKGLLWEISGNGLSQPSYLYGTIHIICPDKFFLPKSTAEKFKTAQQIFLEIDMDDPQMLFKAQKLMMSADGKKLKDLMNETDYKLFGEYFKKNVGMDVAAFGTAKPMFYMSMALMKSAGCPIPKSYEEYFVKEAKSENKEVLGLETIEEQMALLNNAPLQQQIDWLMEIVREAEKSNETYDQMLDLYKKQDIEALTKMISEKMVGMKGIEDEMLDKRNQNWIPVIEKNIKQKPTFFAVGAGHLGGEKGVLKLLQQKGYTLKSLE